MMSSAHRYKNRPLKEHQQNQTQNKFIMLKCPTTSTWQSYSSMGEIF